jgi:phytoene dehydrogenase-like protein
MAPDIAKMDAVVVGSGPNGLAAAIEIARSGFSVAVVEAKDTAGGGLRSAELTLPGFLHDVCSAIHPLALGSPFLSKLPLGERGLQWIHPPVPLAHPLDGGKAAVLYRSIEATASTLGRDGARYRKFVSPLVERWPHLARDILAPVHAPRHPLTLSRFGFSALRSAAGLAKSLFRDSYARALFAGLSAHSFLPLDKTASSAIGIMLAVLGHAVGWPFPVGGSQRLADSMVEYLGTLGGRVFTDVFIRSLSQLPGSKAILLDVTPRQLLGMAEGRLPSLYRKQLEWYRYGPGVFKVDWALDGPIPWEAPGCRLAGTIHVGGALEEIMESEADVWRGNHPERPFVMVAQQSLFDDTRAPTGKHTGWAYCHVPNNSSLDMTERIERQIERFAPGFRDIILARHTLTAREMELHNPNCVGGDINGGLLDLRQILFRPAVKLIPYATPLDGVYICSSSTPPGGGVHGLCGYHAARAALRKMRTGRG